MNLRTKADSQVPEIGGVFYIFYQEFFDSLRDKAGIELENFVYYRNDTHYFVMTAKKCSLVNKGVLREVGDKVFFDGKIKCKMFLLWLVQ